MPTQNHFSTSKIFIYLMIVFFLIASGLMLARSVWHREPPVLASNEGVIFPAPRDIKTFTLQMAEKPFTHKDLLGHWTVLFFGFTHCSDVCPTTLDVLKKVYVTLNESHPNLQIVFVSLDPERDTPTALAEYVHTFNPNFMAATGSLQELRKLQSQLGIFAMRDQNANVTDYQIQHTNSLLLINPAGKWVGVFPYDLKPEQLQHALHVGMQTEVR